MSLSVEKIEAEILTLSEQEQLKLIDFVESLKNKFIKNQVESENGNLSVNYKDYLWGSNKPNKPLKLGLFKGQIKMADDFNDPLPDSFWLEGKL